MTLYLKYRPQSLSEIVGNEEIVESLTTILSKKDRPHSYLLTGGSGCGKTTIGRIIANEIGCKGNDYREIDSADFRGIDSIREIRKQSQFMPLEGSSKVFLLDECHKISNDGMNALLKALEDTPPHVYYILCTTDPQKLLATIKGRCTQFKVNQLQPKEMRRLLSKIAKAEGMEVTKQIYESIIEASKGHPRNAIQMLEQVVSVPEEKRNEIIQKNQEESTQVIELCRALIGNKGWKVIAEILTGIKDQDPEGIRRVVLGYCSSILLKGVEHNKAGLVMEEFKQPTYDIGFPGVVLACYSIVCGGE